MNLLNIHLISTPLLMIYFNIGLGQDTLKFVFNIQGWISLPRFFNVFYHSHPLLPVGSFHGGQNMIINFWPKYNQNAPCIDFSQNKEKNNGSVFIGIFFNLINATFVLKKHNLYVIDILNVPCC